jgi:hypothetical protein
LPANCPLARPGGPGGSLVVPHPPGCRRPAACDTGYAARYVVERQAATPCGTAGLSSQEVCNVPETAQGNQPVLPYPGPGRRRQVIKTRSGRP